MSIRSSDISRRAVLAGLGATFAVPALAAAPMVHQQAPLVYRFKVGGFECTVISDGPLQLGQVKAEMFKGFTQERIDELLAANFLDKNNFQLDQNALVVNTGEKLVLIDAGMGARKMFGEKSGKLLVNLQAAGINPASIDAVAVSHAHPDHCWGLVDAQGRNAFPNAQIYLTQADLDFWTDEGKLNHPQLGGFIGPTRDVLLSRRDRIVFVKDGQEVVPGVQAIATPGHTVGHTSFVISSQGKTLINAADVAHHYLLTLENPRAEFAFDTDPQQAISSRLRLFDMVAAQKTPIIAYHFPWPGLGYLTKRGEGYRYIAAPIQTVL
jgi:glyoxylase-like metal-dependent hydrolase (beta-lactamase superfamily II)